MSIVNASNIDISWEGAVCILINHWKPTMHLMNDPTKSLLADLADSTRQKSAATETHFRPLVNTIMNLRGSGWPLLAGVPNRS